MFLNIDLPVKGMESEILEIARQQDPGRNDVDSSALPGVVMELKARSAAVPVGLVCKRPAELVSWRDLPADYVIVHPPLITRKLIRIIHESARKIFDLDGERRPVHDPPRYMGRRWNHFEQSSIAGADPRLNAPGIAAILQLS